MMNGNSTNWFPAFFALVLVMISCSSERIPEDKIEIEFVATWADTDNTRTTVQEDGTSVWWTTNEEINLFNDNLSSGRFVSTNQQPQDIVAFRGSLDVVTGTIETGPAHLWYWAVYPYNASNSCDGESVTLKVPTIQETAENTFADKLFPAVARSRDFALAFYHVCGGIRFSVKTDGIIGITFKSRKGEPLAGRVSVVFGPDDKPLVDSILSGIDEVTVRAPEQGFVPGKYYFATLLPGTLEEGLSATLVKEGSFGVKQIEKSVTVNRGRFGILDAIDDQVVFSGDVPPGADIIEFKDPNIKACLVAAFDANRDGEISYLEAAEAVSLEGVFGDQKNFTSFDEFRYFTGITSIPSYHGFAYWDQLVSISLPESVDYIGYGAFNGCTSLQSVVLPEHLTTINGSMFSDCSSLQSVALPEHIESIDEYAFYGCTNLNRIQVPGSLKYIGNNAFHNCVKLESFAFPEGLQVIGDRAFCQCESLTSLVIPNTVTTIGQSAFFGCKKLSRLSLPVGLTSISSHMFYGCSSLESIHLPDTLNTIGERAFASSGLKTIAFPSSMQTVRNSAFGRCYDLSEVSLNERLSRIEDDAFRECTSLTSIAFPSSLQFVGNNAFRECASLTTISIPQSIDILEGYSFAYCSALSSCIITRTTPSILFLRDSTTFEGSDNCLFYVPDEVLDTYRSTRWWQEYADRIFPLSSLQ